MTLLTSARGFAVDVLAAALGCLLVCAGLALVEKR